MDNVFHIYPYYSPDRDQLKAKLEEAGIHTLCHYPVPLHQQPCFNGAFDNCEYEEAERIAAQELSLPMSPTMTTEDAQYVVDTIKGHATTPREVPFLDLQAINGRQKEDLSLAAQRVVDKGWYVNGSECHAFEQEFANYCADKSGCLGLHCVGCANGLDALTLILLALKQQNKWSEDCEIIVPAMTFVATGQAVVRAGLTLRLCDVNAQGLIDPMSCAMAISPKTVAIIPVHLYGQRADLTTLADLAQAHGLYIIQDAAQAHGIAIDVPHGDIIAAYSFYPGKNLGALGDGGAVVTDNKALADHIRALANYGSSAKYLHNHPEAFNSRLDEIQAAFLRVKLTILDKDNQARATIAQIYDTQL